MLKQLMTTIGPNGSTRADPAPNPGSRARPNLTRGEIAALFADEFAAGARPSLRA